MAAEAATPSDWYRAACGNAGLVCDAAQAEAIADLDRLFIQLIDFKHKRNQFLGRSLLSPDVPQGLYLWGGVGRGKTFLMDGFYHCLPYRRKRRIHFHHFMVEVHQAMQALAEESDPLLALADQIAHSTRLLCLDEFHVDDIADAMILGRLLAALFKRGVVLLTTSNVPPDGLYPDGLQRQHFLPAIALLQQELKVVQLAGERDYRLSQLERDPVFMLGEDAGGRMRAFYARLAAGGVVRSEEPIPARSATHEVIWFDFDELCAGNHDQSDYLRIARRYGTVFLSDVPHMTADNAAAARRFTWLIDVLYDHHVKLVASLAAAPGQLYDSLDGESRRIVSRLTEMQSHHYLTLPHRKHGVTLA